MPDIAHLSPVDAAAGTRALAVLHTRLLDTIAGYDMILQKAEPEFAVIACEFRDLHLRQAERVSRMLVEDGHDPALDGSIVGPLNRILIVLRSWFDDISTNMMGAVAEGERHVLEAYRAATVAAGDSARRRILGEDCKALVALLDRHVQS